MISAALQRWRGGAREAPRVPSGLRIYAVGDIHGRVDLLQQLQTMLRQDAASAQASRRNILIYLGDYVDRGLDSKAVLELLQDPSRMAGFETVCLKGNHEELMLQALQDPSRFTDWFALGGDATLLSYGAQAPGGAIGLERFEALRRDLLRRVPRDHLAFLEGLELYRVFGDYLFVHAGLRPGISLDRQSPRDLLWIRGPFLKARRPFEKVVVHGHSLTGKPEVGPIRIGIDTGAYATNVLTCLVLEGRERRFLATGRG